jgi:uncharacterized protein
MIVRRLSQAFLLLAGVIFLSSCARSVLEERGPYLRAYHSGNLIEAEGDLTTMIRRELPQSKYELSKNSSWMLLDRATTRFAEGDASGAIEDYSIALEAMDYYSKDLLAEQAAQLMLQDEAGAYQAPDYEQVLARVYMALALLHYGDESNAYALLRQAEDYQQEKQNFYSKIPFTRQYRVQQNGLSKYLFAALLEKRGDFSNACILYKQAAELIPCSREVPFTVAETPKQATILVLCHNGNAPYKISEECPASQASAIALEILLANSGVKPAISTFPGIPAPALQHWPGSNPEPTFAKLCGSRIPLFPFFNVNKAAEFELEQTKPFIIARGVARLALRRAAVGYIGKQDPCLGMIADCAMLVANANTRVDTRSWTTLPAYIDVARFDVEPGYHNLTIQFEGACFDENNIHLNLKPSDLCIINVFNIHPGVRRILIPNRYLAN